MIPSRVAITLLLLVAVMLTAAGCLVSTNGGKDNIIHIPFNPATSPTPATSVKPTLSIHDQPSGYWIKIDPISDKLEGDVFTVNASTNLSVGEEILVQIYREGRYSKSQSGEFAGGEGTVKVMVERDGNNSISFTINSSEFHLTEATYRFFEDAVNENASGLARFNINERNTR
jgi:hypothetical protein